MRGADGGFVTTDAIDHGGSHDLIGCQDIVWDIAGAAVEFDLSPAKEAFLCRAVTAYSGRPAEPGLIGFFKLCYLSFQVGHFTLAAAGCSGPGGMRLDQAAAVYRIKLAHLVAAPAMPMDGTSRAVSVRRRAESAGRD